MTFQIAANGTEMGTYEAATKDEAILAYVRDAGYQSVSEAADVLSLTEDDFLSEITVTEI